MTSTKTIRDELNLAAEVIGGKAWGIDKLKPRIYMPSRRDSKVYFEFPDACYTDPSQPSDGVHFLGGAAFKVYIDDCGQHPNWYGSQKQKIMRSHYRHSLALQALSAGDEQLARDIMELDEVTPAQVDEAGSHLANERLAEARKVLIG